MQLENPALSWPACPWRPLQVWKKLRLLKPDASKDSVFNPENSPKSIPLTLKKALFSRTKGTYFL
jgi:hypothetical protein